MAKKLTKNIDDNISSFLGKLLKEIHKSNLPPKIQKAIRMFKKEKNLLYVDKTDEVLRSVIKSQTNPEKLEYSCSVYHDGRFFCGTQNLRPCGGLRGSICKHIILTLIASIKQNIISERELIDWIKKTIDNTPVLLKPEATAIFLKYKNALEGKIEWRPVEVYPEDFIAF